jgi:hypothetical protein
VRQVLESIRDAVEAHNGFDAHMEVEITAQNLDESECFDISREWNKPPPQWKLRAHHHQGRLLGARASCSPRVICGYSVPCVGPSSRVPVHWRSTMVC